MFKIKKLVYLRNSIFIFALTMMFSSSSVIAKDITESTWEQIEAGKNLRVEQNSTNSATQAEKIKTRIQDLKDKIATRQAEKKLQLSEQLRERIRNRFQLMLNRMNAAVIRFNHVLERITTRFEKLNRQGVSTADLEIQANLIKDNLNEAKSLLTTAETEFNNIVLESDTPKDGFYIIKDTIHQFVEAMKNIHTQLRNLVKEMKVSAGQGNPNQPEPEESSIEP
jgi:hypothetical protein